MATVKVLAVVVCMVLGAAAGPFNTNGRYVNSRRTDILRHREELQTMLLVMEFRESCDFTNIDLGGAVEKVLERLPKFKLLGSQTFKPAFAGLEIGGANVSGFNEFHQYGPLLPYCTRVNGTRMLELDLITVEGTELSIPWRHCSGNEGSVKLRSSLGRITTQFRVNVPESGQGVSLSYVGPTVPTASEGVVLLIRGAGEIGKQLGVGLNIVFRALIHQMWSDIFYREFDLALHEALEENVV